MIKNTAGQSSPPRDIIENYNEKIDELYRPFLIHPTIYVILTEQILTLMPTERNVILAMNEYSLKDINPTHPETAESPTHIIIFCIRLVTADVFQPIGGLLIYRDEDQSVILAECLKAYVNDLWKLGLYVMATVSPPFTTFKKMLSHLVKVENFNSFSGVIAYSVTPIKEIIHIYDVQFLLIKLQNLLKEGNIRFEEEYPDKKRAYIASWDEVQILSSFSVEYRLLDEYMQQTREVSRRIHVFTHQIYQQLSEAEAKGLLSSHATGTVVLLSCVRSFARFIEEDEVDVRQLLRMNDWDGFLEILKSMTFQKSKLRTHTKEKKCATRQESNNSTARRRLDFADSCNLYDNMSDHVAEKLFIDEGKDGSKKSKSKRNRKKVSGADEVHDKEEKTKKTTVNNGVTVVSLCKVSRHSRPQSDKNCDIDKNNNSDESVTSNDAVMSGDTEHRKKKTHRKKARNMGGTYVDVNESDDIDVVINSPERFFQSLIQCNNDTSINLNGHRHGSVHVNSIPKDDTDSYLESKGSSSIPPSNSKVVVSKDIFSSKSDDETENCITASCDKVPNILELLSKVDGNETNSDNEFRTDATTMEMLCTVYGIRRLLQLLINRRIRVAKPDAFLIDHVDYFVTTIKREKNGMSAVHHYGHNYEFMNAELAFATLNNNSGLYLVSKT